ncbi:MAG: polysaccharide biosynthesis protein [Phycisphaerae bacterium]|nr:polysaccharide biosynthesis protein [Phycisphaerae bacterium]NUQ45996.1 polysaccharide biosynthesis protein [Phycisphaerae bacterium]
MPGRTTQQRTPFYRFLSRYRNAVSVSAHVLLFAAAFFTACGMLDNFWHFDRWFRPVFLRLVWFPVIIKVVVFYLLGLYRAFWRYVGMRDAVQVFRATTWSTCLFILVYLLDRVISKADPFAVFYEFPESIFILDWGATIVLVIGARAAVRLYYEESRLVASGGLSRCLILGAGNTGEALLREIFRMPEDRYRVAGFLDDDPGKQAARIHDVPVLGTLDEVRAIAEQYHVSDLLIAMPNIKQKRLQIIVKLCQGTNLRFRTVPALPDVVAGRVSVSQMRDVDINDLLGRDPVQLDNAAIAAFIENRRVVVTGAGGSIGSEICRQVARYKPARIVLIEQAENNLFQIDRELSALAPDVPRCGRVADIADAARIERVFDEERPQVVFHAAAHKHVPLMETNIGEAIKNNVRGTMLVAEAACRSGVEKFVMISTDKAVNPTSVMGCSKRVAELGLQHLGRRHDTQFITVRFGNVLGSSGSVVPIFQEQIARGGPVTVTHPDMTRYFMTIPEATQLVLQAAAMGSGGEIFVLDMGEPVRIVDLARQMITLMGFRPGEDVEIMFTGIRPGEKLFEELSVCGEDMSPTQHEKIYVWRQRQEDWDRIADEIDDLVCQADRASTADLKRMLKRMVPEYQPDPNGDAPLVAPAAPESHEPGVADEAVGIERLAAVQQPAK